MPVLPYSMMMSSQSKHLLGESCGSHYDLPLEVTQQQTLPHLRGGNLEPTTEWKSIKIRLYKGHVKSEILDKLFSESMICLMTKIQKQAGEDWALPAYQKIHWEVLESSLSHMRETWGRMERILRSSVLCFQKGHFASEKIKTNVMSWSTVVPEVDCMGLNPSSTLLPE